MIFHSLVDIVLFHVIVQWCCFAGCGIETVAADAKEERQPKRTEQFVSDNVKRYENRSDPDNPFYVCVIVREFIIAF